MTTGSVRVHRAVGAVRGHRVVGALIAALAAVLTVLGGAGTASAHAALVSTDPAQNSVVARQPSAVTLTFGEGMTLPADSLRVFDPAGRRVDVGTPGHAGGRAETARVALRDGLADGTYTVAWQAISADSHPIGGAFTFSIGAPSASSVSLAPLQGTRTDGLISFLYGTGRAIAYAAFALLAGAVAFVLICWPAGASVRRAQQLMAAGWVGLLGSTVVLLMLRGPYEQGSGIAPSADSASTHAEVPVDERIYIALAARLLLLVASGVFLVLLVGQLGQPGTDAPGQPGTDATGRSRSRSRLGLAGLVLAVGLSATWVTTDHASEGPQVWLALPVTALHLLAMAAWLGGLVTLAVGLRHGLAPAAVGRFSQVAFVSVTVLVLTGLYQSWRELGSWDALFDTEYGQLLLIKTACVAAMLVAAWLSRSRLARLRSDTEAVEGGSAREDRSARAGGSVRENRSARAGGSVREEGAGRENSTVRTDDPARENNSARTDDPVREEGAVRENNSVRTDDPARENNSARTDDPVREDDNSTWEDGSTQAGGSTRAGLRRSVLVESAVAVVVLVVTTMLTASPPGRTADAEGSASQSPAASAASTAPGRTVTVRIPFDTGGRTANAKGTATLSLAPAAAGGYTVGLRLTDADGKPADEPEVRLAFTLPARDLGPLQATLRPEGAGRWSGAVPLTLAGNWTVSLTVRSSDIDEATSTRQLTIGG
ncbi:copper resistance CopC/CopD family protein [Streptomyces ipomoeae]|uniref:copper resistance CopC/CopD family protein n=1 Tax=Streptomyces ipomoeae TaxID=103232 RepID=UPI001146B99C|nr:FixH family protein [Streptomyces ipomoeae]MDX2934609.1 FixH family protein [Streptomyces ipomoeae]TQE19007.1 ABC transporter [Streptomyces ipomoeae]